MVILKKNDQMEEQLFKQIRGSHEPVDRNIQKKAKLFSPKDILIGRLFNHPTVKILLLSVVIGNTQLILDQSKVWYMKIVLFIAHAARNHLLINGY